MDDKDEIDNNFKNNYINDNPIFIKEKNKYEYIELKIYIEKSKLKISESKYKELVPNILKFSVFYKNYPNDSPILLSINQFSETSLADGRDLFNEVCPNWNWNKNSRLIDITLNINRFCENIINSVEYKYYGMFHIGANYLLRNLESMSLNLFDCRNLNVDRNYSCLFEKSKNYVVALSDDSFILLQYTKEKEECKSAKVVFWCNLFAISSMVFKRRENRRKSLVSLRFFNGKQDQITFSFNMEKYIFFRESLFKKMEKINILRTNVENSSKKLQMPEISLMKINEIEKQIKDHQENLNFKKGDDYEIKILNLLSNKKKVLINFYPKKLQENNLENN